MAPLDGLARWGSAMRAVAIPNLGPPLIEQADLEALSRACATVQRWTFPATIALLRIKGLTDPPVNPKVFV